MIDIILINPKFNISKDNYDSSISVGLLCIASYLSKKGLSVKIIDGARQKDYESILEKEAKNARIAGFSVMTTQISEALQDAGKIKKINPETLIIFGGLHSTLFPKETAEHELIDIAVFGEGEETLFEIISAYNNTLLNREDFEKFLGKLESLKGIAFKNAIGKITKTEKRPLLKMSDIPLPNWDSEPKEILEHIDIIPTHTSRGCPHRCAFCINAVTKNLWRARAPEEVLEDIKIIKSKEYFKNKPMRFWDENFFVDKNRAEKIINLMIEKDIIIPWETTIRADYIKPDFINDEFLAKLKKSGCYLLSFGAESGSNEILKKIDKDIKREDIIASAKLCAKHNIIPQYSFMVGLPGETKKDIKLTLSLIDNLTKASNLTQILGPQVFRPYPGGALYEECLKAGWKSPEKITDWAKIVKDELNYLSPKNFPWLSDPEYIESLEAYVRFGAHSIRSALGSTVKSGKLLKLGFILACKLRWKLKFFKWSFEYRLAKNFILKSKVY